MVYQFLKEELLSALAFSLNAVLLMFVTVKCFLTLRAYVLLGTSVKASSFRFLVNLRMGSESV